jgi:beta-mannanase
MRARVTTLLVLVGTLALFAYQQGLFGRAHSASAAPAVPAKAARAGALELGVTTGPLARNWWAPWTSSDLSTVTSFERDAGKHAAIVMWYADWAHNASPSVAQLNLIARRGSVPEITWEPWDASKGLYVSQPAYRLTNITAGRFDRYIWTWARTLAKWKHPVLLRFAQEMDGNWFPWDEYGNGNRPGQFVPAWRHVWHIFQLAGATNVRWVWSPAFANSAETFPGKGYVDVLATTCQNGDKQLFARGWESFAKDCGPTITRLHAIAPGLPIQLAETGSAEAGGSKAAWIRGMFSYLARHSDVKSVVWFNLVKGVDWRIESSAAAQRAFAAGARAIDAA